jgi:hypothetical protein
MFECAAFFEPTSIQHLTVGVGWLGRGQGALQWLAHVYVDDWGRRNKERRATSCTFAPAVAMLRPSAPGRWSGCKQRDGDMRIRVHRIHVPTIRSQSFLRLGKRSEIKAFDLPGRLGTCRSRLPRDGRPQARPNERGHTNSVRRRLQTIFGVDGLHELAHDLAAEVRSLLLEPAVRVARADAEQRFERVHCA